MRFLNIFKFTIAPITLIGSMTGISLTATSCIGGSGTENNIPID
ncbi:hypothetical protein FACS189459_6640 [Bacilli bacterium]|nr:hypothetical protein FACS189459_6640 [Bacilli bacterium]